MRGLDAVSQEDRAMKKRWIAIPLVLLLMAGMACLGYFNFSFVSETIFAESTAHLTELFHQANQTLNNLVSINWSRMRMWAPYLAAAGAKRTSRSMSTRRGRKAVSPISSSFPATAIT